jgi:penicillin amidase
MFQMDLTRLAGRGELSALFGESMLATDKYFKTLGFYRAAESEYNNITPATRRVVDSYTRGVNYYLDTVKFLPAEYNILGAKPQAWKPADSMVAGLLMSYRLNAPRAIKPILYMIYKQSGPDMLKELLPYIPDGAPYISSSGNQGPTAARCELPGPPTSATGESSFSAIEAPIPLRMHASN